MLRTSKGFFWTNFLDHSSLARTNNVIADYDETVGKMREFATQASYKQSGDPAKLADAIVKLAAYREKTAAFEKEIAGWHDVISSTDHDDVMKSK